METQTEVGISHMRPPNKQIHPGRGQGQREGRPIQMSLHHIKEHFGQVHNIPSLKHLSQAAQKRVAVWENEIEGGLAIQARHEQLQAAIRESDFLNRYVLWNRWYQHGPVSTLHNNNCILDALGFDNQTLLVKAGARDRDVAQRARGMKRVKKVFQRTVKKALCGKDKPDLVARIRHKLARWNLAGLPRTNATRCAKLFKDLGGLVPPRVSSAVWKTIWNGWATKRRFQVHDSSCLLCCGGRFAEDSVEHYAHCAVVKEVAGKHVGLAPAKHGLGTNHGTVAEAILVKRAVLVYAVYTATNYLRHNPSHDATAIADMIAQFAREAVRGHSVATRLLQEWD